MPEFTWYLLIALPWITSRNTQNVSKTTMTESLHSDLPAGRQYFIARFRDSPSLCHWARYSPSSTEQNLSIPAIIERGQKSSFSFHDLRTGRGSTPKLSIYLVPYSEHSSFFDLTCFAVSIDWVKIIATVNIGSESSRAKMDVWFQKWQAARKKFGGRVTIQQRDEDYW